MRAKLRTMSSGKAPRVDRSGHGRILGASLMAIGPALGHGFEIDGTTLDQVAKLAEGVPGRWTHGSLCADGLGTHLGRWTNVKREGDRVTGDFAFSELAKRVQPSGLSVDAPTYLMDLAEKEPDVAGVSAVIDYELETVKGEKNEKDRQFCRVQKVGRADVVADPAANPSGMFSETPSALAEQATAALNEAAEVHGQERVRAFLSAYLGTTTTEAPMNIEELKKKHGEELAAKDTQIAALKATVTEFEAAKAKREADEIDGYVASLKKDATPNAIDEKKLEHVRVLLKAGHGEAARSFGATLLAAAKAPAGAGGTVLSTAVSGQADPKAATAYAAAQLREAGWTVELSADGTQITKKVPPAKAGR